MQVTTEEHFPLPKPLVSDQLLSLQNSQQMQVRALLHLSGPETTELLYVDSTHHRDRVAL